MSKLKAKLKGHSSSLLIRYILKDKTGSLLILAFSFISSTLSSLGLGLLVPVIFKVFRFETSDKGPGLFEKILDKYLFFIPHDSSASLLLFVIILFLVKNVLIGIRTYLIAKALNKNLVNFRTDLSTHFLKKDLYFYYKEGSGRILNQLLGNVEKASRSITNFIELIGMTFQLIAYFIVLTLISWKLFALCLLFLGPLVYLLKKSSATLKELSRSKAGLSGSFSQKINDTVRGIRSVKLANREQDHINWIRRETLKTQDLSTTMFLLMNIKQPITEMAAVFIFLGFGAASLYYQEAFTLELNTFFSFMLLLSRALPLFNVVTTKSLEIVAESGVLSEIYNALEDKRWITHEKQKIPMFSLKNEIEIKDLNFQYPEKQTLALNSINLKITKGQSIAIVGPSGSGKSTLCDLLLRFYNPTSGSILFDGENIKNIDITQYRKRVGMVSQEPSLFFSTIKDNVSYFAPNSSELEIWRALEYADLADFVSSLPEGLNTVIGEGGVTLSGGQKQRLTIARTLLMSPEVVIFDEATSSLDSISEAKIVDAIKNLSKGRTSITIAHRLATILHCDKIYLLEHGWIVESGSITELLSKNSRFKKYAEAQNLKLVA